MDKGEPRRESPVTLDEVMAEAASMMVAPPQQPWEISVLELMVILDGKKTKSQQALNDLVASGLMYKRYVILKANGRKGIVYSARIDPKIEEPNEDDYINAWKELSVKLSEA